MKTEKTCCSSFNGHRMAYTAHGRLRVELGTPIYECNKKCTCDKECTNRVVQKGRKVRHLFNAFEINRIAANFLSRISMYFVVLT